MTGSLYDCLLFFNYTYLLEIDIEICYQCKMLTVNLFIRWCGILEIQVKSVFEK